MLGLLVVGANWKAVFGGETFVLRDFTTFGYPLAAHVKASFWAGELPLWSPFNECGHPFLAQWNTMSLYPPIILYLLLPLSWALGVFCLIHQYLGGLGMYFLARRWSRNSHGACLAGVIYAFNGIMQTSLMWPNNIAALGALPWVALIVRLAWHRGGRWVIGAALVSGLQMLSGAPEVILFTWGLAALVLLLDMWQEPANAGRRLMRFVAVVLVTAMLAAAQLIPFFDLLRQTVRVGEGEKLEWFIHWYGWANFLLPLFENIGPQPSGVFFQQAQKWTHSYYVGLLPWVLVLPALVANRSKLVWGFAGATLFAMVLAMGPEGRVYVWLDRFLPLEVMRYPVKYLVVCIVALPLIASFGLRRLAVRKVNEHTVHSIVAVTMLFAATVALLERMPMPVRGRPVAEASIKWQVIWLVVFAVIVMLLPRYTKVRRSICLLALVLLTTADLKWHQGLLSPSIPRNLYERPNPNLAILEGAVYPDGRLLPNMATQNYNLTGRSVPMKESLHTDRAAMFSNVNLIERMAQVDGFFSLWVPHFADMYWELFDGQFLYHDRLADFVGLTHINSTNSPYEWLERPTVQPVITVGRRPEFVTMETAHERFKSPEFDPAEMVYLPAGTEDVFAVGRVPEATVADVNLSPMQISFRVNTPRPTVATIAQTHYHWWQAKVGGQDTPIYFANRAFQAIPIPAGEHQVTLVYVDWGFRTGALISTVTLAICLLVLLRRRANIKPA